MQDVQTSPLRKHVGSPQQTSRIQSEPRSLGAVSSQRIILTAPTLNYLNRIIFRKPSRPHLGPRTGQLAAKKQSTKKSVQRTKALINRSAALSSSFHGHTIELDSVNQSTAQDRSQPAQQWNKEQHESDIDWVSFIYLFDPTISSLYAHLRRILLPLRIRIHLNHGVHSWSSNSVSLLRKSR